MLFSSAASASHPDTAQFDRAGSWFFWCLYGPTATGNLWDWLGKGFSQDWESRRKEDVSRPLPQQTESDKVVVLW